MVLAMDTPKDLIGLADAAREYGKEKLGAIGVTYYRLRGWVVRGEIRSWKQGELYFVSRADLESMIQPKPTRRDDTAEG